MSQKLRKIAPTNLSHNKAFVLAIIVGNMSGKLAFKATYFLILFLPFLFACDRKSSLFKKVDSGVSNIHFSNELKNSPDLNILNYLYYYNGAGVAAADYNSDGLVDLYLVSNQGEDKLYLNRGNLKFEDITKGSQISNSTGWSTGVSNVDINNDGLMDIYISKVGGFRGLTGKNLLYVNQGVSEEGIPFFKEEAADYGLDFSGFSTQAVFLDYDLDGDLDMFLLNHSVYPNRNYGSGKKRELKDPSSGDILFRNNNGKFVDISEEANIFQGTIGYGLGVGVGDINNDGFPDIYVGNDFFENDYLYINNGNGTFREIISEDASKLGHTSHFSMGNDIADLNNDGLADIISLDMLPEDLMTYKTSGLEYPYQTYENYLRMGFSPQYMQNTFHINRGDLNFSEAAFLSGIAATEWSWGVLAADFDNDGLKDLYITNGIKGATNDMDFINFIADEKIQKKISSGMTSEDLEFISHIPEKKIPNYFFKNKGNNAFEDVTKTWTSSNESFSNGFVYADLDNDGDLDIVVNNVNQKASLLENHSNEKINNSLKIELKGGDKNKFGVGAKVLVYNDGGYQMQEHYLTKGYLSSVAPGLHFGVGNAATVDSVKVIWPNGNQQVKYNIRVERDLIFSHLNATKSVESKLNSEVFLTRVDSLFEYEHQDFSSLDFNREPLVPFAYSNQGPSLSVGDLNKDGLDDIFFSGGKKQSPMLFYQTTDGNFEKFEEGFFDLDAINEDVAHAFFDADGDDRLDIIVVSGGNEFTAGEPLKPRLYLNKENGWIKDEKQFSELFVNASSVKIVDLNQDGSQDISITSNTYPGQFGRTPLQYLLLNDGQGNFKDVTREYSETFQNIGNVQNIEWIDLNKDQFPDAIVVGHWIPVTIFLNDGKKLVLQEQNGLKYTNGWWNSIEAGDFDNDGDVDLIAGNWGLNTRLTASRKNPLKLYLNDFDNNGNVEPVVTYYYKGEETPFASKDELVKQMPFLNKKFLSYKQFAEAKFSEILPSKKLRSAEKKEVHELASAHFENKGNGKFVIHRLPFDAQLSPVFDIQKYDFNLDGFDDFLLVGNNFEISTLLGRSDASHGVFLLNGKNGKLNTAPNGFPGINGPARQIEKICIYGIMHFVITMNNGKPVVLKTQN